ncbi:TPA: hypothetical protein U1B40_001351 [Streptococcus suis]|uniref:hypothetical protein n=1 Tax=Streptococcus suis TaxID=1307 RepID=UPI00042048EE|nr:hypothetical protein [Streptococcus suis]MBL6440623.1 hypothetical protein [Streptococcus suis]MBM7138549.1 hypothetical protein [Streptococcus suis]MBY4601648.1 hypothetical protein [Streptococcus suis]MCO8173360.1 hypothetical protein [Streptococcus suis]MCO8181744.1 hypothetical protein [Streptococcus suis]
MKKLVCASCLLLLLVGCTSKETNQSEEQTVVKPIQTTNATQKEYSSFDVIADNFMKTYIEQSFDLEELAQKQKKLEDIAGDSSLDVAISDVVALQSEVEEYQNSKVLRTSASVTLVERSLQHIEVYKKGALYFADVTFKEDSPAYNGAFERRKQYSFKIQDSKVVQFEEVLTR